MSEDLLLCLSARAGAFSYLDLASKIEVFALASFTCSLLGSLSPSFPLAANLGVALVALLACRGRSEAQLTGLCGFCLFRPRRSARPTGRERSACLPGQLTN